MFCFSFVVLWFCVTIPTQIDATVFRRLKSAIVVSSYSIYHLDTLDYQFFFNHKGVPISSDSINYDIDWKSGGVLAWSYYYQYCN